MKGPEISVPREARPFQGESAGIVTRFVANSIDAAVVALALGGLYLGWCVLLFMIDPRAFAFPETTFLVTLTVGMGISIFYLWLAWWLLGQTYGGHIMGIRVSGRRGRRLGPLRSLARAWFCVLFPIGLFWCVISPRRRSVQDVVLFTKVVYDWLPRSVAGAEPPAEGESAPSADPASSGETGRPQN